MIESAIQAANRKGEAALIPYLTAGFPTLDASMNQLETLDRAGADVIEVGVPFGDPVADGPTIQRASHVALENGATLRRILDASANLTTAAPRVLMSYLNPLLALGEGLFERLAASQVRGLIIPDLPVEEAEQWSDDARRREIDLILLAAPTSGHARIEKIAHASRGFLYYVTVAGITGARRELPQELIDELKQVKQLSPVPVAAGFGISTPAHVSALREVVDGVVVGSRIVQAIESNEDVESLVKELKLATRRESHVGRHEIGR